MACAQPFWPDPASRTPSTCRAVACMACAQLCLAHPLCRPGSDRGWLLGAWSVHQSVVPTLPSTHIVRRCEPWAPSVYTAAADSKDWLLLFSPFAAPFCLPDSRRKYITMCPMHAGTSLGPLCSAMCSMMICLLFLSNPAQGRQSSLILLC